MPSYPVFDVDLIRSQFPALSRVENGLRVAYLDGPGGTQTPRRVIDAMSDALEKGISNLGGGFGASAESDRIVEDARSAMADFFNCSVAEVAFGQNMTSLTFSLSRALSNTWDRGDAIVLTSLDHDANFTPWARAAHDRGVEVRVAEFDVESGELNPSAVEELLDDRVRLVAVCAAANSIGTVVDVEEITRMAQTVGALVFVDAVHMGPHRVIDVQAIGCDFLVASSYKFFGPHTGILYGRLDRLAEANAYKVRPAPSDPPGKWETGTQSFESLAGVTAAVDHLAGLGQGGGSRRERLVDGFDRIGVHEGDMAARFLAGCGELADVRIYGSSSATSARVATFALRKEGQSVRELASQMVAAGLYVWSGDYYALNAMDRLGITNSDGLVRVGFVHYNTAAEVDRVLEVMAG